ncbi:MAG: type II secretion system F family protein [Proteobacteria bacterium]|nr:type II secretion system F family protein [Pseudomonadota bacterium]
MSNSFYWYGIDSNGLKITGQESASDQDALKRALQKQGITLLSIRKKYFQKKKRVSFLQISEFTASLAILLQANIGLMESLQIILEENTNSVMKDIIGRIKQNLEQGLSFNQALRQLPKYFDTLYCSLIAAGESSGTLTYMLALLSEYQHRLIHLRSKIIKSLFYPATVTIVAFLITSGLLLFVVPQFKSIFSSFNAQLPFFTNLVINISTYFQKQIMVFILAIAMLGIGYHFAIKRSQKLKFWKDIVLLKLPWFGNLLQIAVTAQWTKILATLLSAKLPLNHALRITENTINNQKLRLALAGAIVQITEGCSFYHAMANQSCFPLKVIQMIKVGETTGQLDCLLNKASEIHQTMLDKHLEYLSKWLEPAIMLILGIITGSLIIAMYLPIFKLGAAI